MNNVKVIVLLAVVLLQLGCGIIIFTTAKWEKSGDYEVTPETRPSCLIKKYLGDSVLNENNNYCLTFYDIYCGFSYQQIHYCNKLFEETRENFMWVAISAYDSISEFRYREKANISNDLVYLFSTFHNVVGLKSSLRNLYYNNQTPERDIVPMTIIIGSDSIRRITSGAINSEVEFNNHKILLDSLSK